MKRRHKVMLCIIAAVVFFLFCPFVGSTHLVSSVQIMDERFGASRYHIVRSRHYRRGYSHRYRRHFQIPVNRWWLTPEEYKENKKSSGSTEYEANCDRVREGLKDLKINNLRGEELEKVLDKVLKAATPPQREFIRSCALTTMPLPFLEK